MTTVVIELHDTNISGFRRATFSFNDESAAYLAATSARDAAKRVHMLIPSTAEKWTEETR